MIVSAVRSTSPGDPAFQKLCGEKQDQNHERTLIDTNFLGKEATTDGADLTDVLSWRCVVVFFSLQRREDPQMLGSDD
jgi:hypothetical protein